MENKQLRNKYSRRNRYRTKLLKELKKLYNEISVKS